MSAVGNFLNNTDASFDPRNYGFPKLSSLARAQDYLEVKQGAGNADCACGSSRPRRRPPAPRRPPRRSGSRQRSGHGREPRGRGAPSAAAMTTTAPAPPRRRPAARRRARPVPACSGGGARLARRPARPRPAAGTSARASRRRAPLPSPRRRVPRGRARPTVADRRRRASDASSGRSSPRASSRCAATDVGKARFDVQKIVDAHDGEVTEEKTETDDDGEVTRSRLVVRVPVDDFDADDVRAREGRPARSSEPQLRGRHHRGDRHRGPDPGPVGEPRAGRAAARPGAEHPRHRRDRGAADPAPGRPRLAEGSGRPTSPTRPR